MIKVMNIISDSNIGGAGRCLINYIKYHDRTKFKVFVVVPRGSLLIEQLKPLQVEVIEVDGIADKSFDLGAVLKINKIIKQYKPDIIHTHGAVTGRISGRLCGKKVVYTRHSVFPVSDRIKKGIGRYINKSLNEFLADDIMAVAEAAKENLTDGGISPHKVKVILNGVEPVEKETPQQMNETREKYGVTENDFVMGILARLDAVKGHDMLIDVVEALKEKNSNIKLIIAGTGPEEENLKNKVKQKGLEDTIIMAGFVSEVKKLLSILDLQLNASFGTEATSLALLEGMSLGIPAVVSDYGGNPGVISYGENGYLFKTKDTQDMIKHIQMVLDDKEKYNEMCKKSEEIFNQKFTAKIYAGNIEKVYTGMMNGKRGAF